MIDYREFSRLHVRRGASYWAVLAFLLFFAIVLVVVSDVFLVPAAQAVEHATHDQKRSLVAVSRLILALVLVILFSALILTFRVGRMFQPRPRPPRSKTIHIDAWAEAGHRLKKTDEE